jgi:serine/threonine protein kinase/tetratricopeptide (TPR) repeat protein
MASNLPNLKPGDVVAGRFRVVEMIGSGGFSVVYRAHQEEMNRFVALKVLKPTASNDEKIVERFRREALYASHLTHPNTITLFDYGTTEDALCYIAMEYLVGMDLSEVVQRHVPMDLQRVWRILVQTCRSLAEAHRLGLVHRDLKPENIFLCQREDGEFVKVLDFGVSKAISSFGDAGPATLAPLTQEGTVFGTPLYMAPEQAMAESITPAVDVYAMGHIAYEMISGHAAYEGCNNAMDVMLRQINDPPLALPEPWNDTPFNQLITLATQKDPAHRLQNASVLMDALMDDQFQAYIDPTERPQRQSTLPRTPTVGPPGDTEPLISREEIEQVYRWELEVLDTILNQVEEQSEVRLVVIRGKRGTGRSNLLRAFLSKVFRRPDIMVMHRAADDKTEAGLENELSTLTGEPLRGHGMEEVKRLLRQLYGDDEELSHTAQELGTDSRPLNTLSTLRDTILSRIATPFRQKAEETPVVWGLENLERLDTLTLAFLDRFFRDLQAHPAPVMFVVTVYPEDLRRRPGLVRYTQGLMQADDEFSRQLSLVPPGEAKSDDSLSELEGIPEDLPTDGSYLGIPDIEEPPTTETPSEPPTEQLTLEEDTEEGEQMFPDAATERVAVDETPAETAFDQVLGYLAQLGDEIPVDLWKLVYARILSTDLIRLADTVLSQADKFGIISRTDDVIRFTKPGFAAMLRESFEDLPGAQDAHLAVAEVMQKFFNEPTHENIKTIAEQWHLGGRPAQAMRLLYEAGEASYQSLDLDAAREYFLRIQKIMDAEGGMPDGEDPIPFGPSQVWLRLGEIHGALNEHGAAEDALGRALQDADPNDREISGRAHKLLGDLSVSQDRFGDALRHYETGRNAFRELGQARPFVAITGEMGQAALKQGRAALAEDLTRQALDMASKLNDDSLVARVHRQMGQVLTRRARFLEADEFLKRSMELFESIGRDYDVIECLVERGHAHFASGDYSASREHFTRAVALSSSMHVATTHEPHLGIARALAASENLDQAEAHLAEALARTGTSRELNRMAEVHLYTGDLHLARSDHRQATEHYERVIELAKSIGLTQLWISALVRLAYVALDRGDEQAIYGRLGEALEQAQALQDTDSDLQIRAHIIYTQLLQHGFKAKGDTFSSLLNASAEQDLQRAAALCYLFKADVAAARESWQEARELLRAAHASAAQLGDYALFIPIARRNYLIQKEAGELGDPHVGAGFAIGSLIPPEVGERRFDRLPEATE